MFTGKNRKSQLSEPLLTLITLRSSEREKPPGGGLFPLNEQGEYGQPPKGPLPPPPPYKRRELR